MCSAILCLNQISEFYLDQQEHSETANLPQAHIIYTYKTEDLCMFVSL